MASAAAFLLSELADFAVYTPLQSRGLVLAVLASSVVGLLVDSVLFLWLAFGSLEFLAGQILGKFWMVLLALPVVHWIRKREMRLTSAVSSAKSRNLTPLAAACLNRAVDLFGGESAMIKSILAVSEGGPDAAMSFSWRPAWPAEFDGTVDALHLPVGPAGGMVGGLAMSGEAMPLMMNLDDERLEERSKESERAYKEIAGADQGRHLHRRQDRHARYPGGDGPLLRHPGARPARRRSRERGAGHRRGRHLRMRPRRHDRAARPPATGAFGSVIVAWNGSFQAARAVEYALPFLQGGAKVTILVAGSKPDDVGASYLARNLGRHGINATIDAIDPGAVSGRARGRALLDYTHGKGADLLVMGAYGRGQVMSFLGLGGATGKVISSCRVPLLMAH